MRAQQTSRKVHPCPKESWGGNSEHSVQLQSTWQNKNSCCSWQRRLIGFSVDVWLAQFSFMHAEVSCLKCPCSCFCASGLRLGVSLLSGRCLAMGIECAVDEGLEGCRGSRCSPSARSSVSDTWNWWTELAFWCSACLHSNTHLNVVLASLVL